MQRGYVKLWRKSLDSALIRNPELWLFWTWCLLKASHKEKKVMVGYQEITLAPGDFIFGRFKASEELCLSERKIRTCLKTLKKTENVTIKVTNKFSIISVINWPLYQGGGNESDQQSDQQATSKRPASDHKQECIKNVKNVKGGNNRKKFIPPNESDVIQYFKEKGYLVSVAKKAFDFYDVADWKDSRGKQILNWKQKMLGVWLKDENKDTEAIVWRKYE